MSLKIAIVGAGPAGLACAHRLATAGAAVTLFEKSRGVGGRCATRRSDLGAFHHGAPSFTAQGAAFRAAVARWQAAGAVRPAVAAGTWVGWPTMHALARQMAAGLQVVTEATVTALVQDVGGAVGIVGGAGNVGTAGGAGGTGGAGAAWQLRFAEAGVAPAGGFDAVVVAAPAEQALALTRASAGLQAWLQTVRSEPCWTLMLAWPPGGAPAAPPTLPGGIPLAAVVDCSALPHMSASDTPAAAPPPGVRWVLHATADWSRAHVEATPAEATTALLQALSAAAGRPLPPPVHAVAHRWRYAQVAVPAAAPFGWDAALRLGSCGDAWQGAAVPAGAPSADGVERAWLSGVGLADAVLGTAAAGAAPA